MAEKTVKKPAKNAEVVKTVDELKAEVVTKRADLLEAKRSLAAGELANPRVLGTYRKDIARLLTEINLKEQQ
jgi:ribosomal protein L29